MAVSAISVSPELSIAHVEPYIHMRFKFEKLDFLKTIFSNLTCGVFCSHKQPANDQPVFMNNNGMLERYSCKGDPIENHIKSLSRIEYFVKETFKNADGSSQEKVYKKVQEKANLNFDEARNLKQSLTLGKIRDLEKAIEDVAKEEKMDMSPVRRPFPKEIEASDNSSSKNSSFSIASAPKSDSEIKPN